MFDLELGHALFGLLLGENVDTKGAEMFSQMEVQLGIVADIAVNIFIDGLKRVNEHRNASHTCGTLWSDGAQLDADPMPSLLEVSEPMRVSSDASKLLSPAPNVATQQAQP